MLFALLLSGLLTAKGWNIDALHKPPAVYPAPGIQAEGVRALFFEGPKWRGESTRIFAWYGAPKDANSQHKVPGMVLVHGGLGTAHAEWVRLWNSRGYAAIALDTCGSVPVRTPDGKAWQRHASAGPAGWGGFDQVAWEPTDQWTYHAVAGIILANSLLRSFPEVDPDRIGLTGISWGGYLTAIAGSLDSRFRFAAPVYGCGFLGEDSVFATNLAALGAEHSRLWTATWDPSVYLERARIPFLWINGTNDFAFPLGSMQKSYRLPKAPRTVSIHPRMEHSQEHGAAPEEIHAFADQLLQRGTPLPRIVGQGRDGQTVWIRFQSGQPLRSAELLYTLDMAAWKDRKWLTVPATVDTASSRATAALPPGATVYFFNLTDDRGMIVSSEW